MNPSVNNLLSSLRRALAAGLLIIILWCVYVILSSLIVAQNTGVLKVTTANSSATLSVSQNDHQAKIIGSGKAKVRLKPGTYLLFAKDGSTHASAVVQVTKKQTTTSNLKLSSGALIPSVYDINFLGTSTLIDKGLAQTQLSNLELAFFQYNKAAKTININPLSVQPGPYDHNNPGPVTLNFSVAIDAVSYNATVSYSGLQSVRLFLYNATTNAQLFDSWAGGTGAVSN